MIKTCQQSPNEAINMGQQRFIRDMELGFLRSSGKNLGRG